MRGLGVAMRQRDGAPSVAAYAAERTPSALVADLATSPPLHLPVVALGNSGTRNVTFPLNKQEG